MNKTRLQRQLCVDWLQARHPKQQEQRQTDGSKRRRIDAGPPALTHCTESDLLQSLDHPHLVEWIDYFEDAHNMYLVTEWVNGTVLVDLHHHEAKPVAASQWHSIFTQLVALLDYCK
jgi:serine/threonine protein kinase